MFIILRFRLYCLIVLITKRLIKILIREFSVAFDELNCCEPPIKIEWFYPESIVSVRCDQKLDDVKTYIEGALKHSLAAKHTFILAPYVEQ